MPVVLHYNQKVIAAAKPDFLKAGIQAFYDFEKRYIEHIVELMTRYDKPVFGVSMLTKKEEQTVYRVKGSTLKGVFFATPERAVKAFAKMYEYERFLERCRAAEASGDLNSKNSGSEGPALGDP